MKKPPMGGGTEPPAHWRHSVPADCYVELDHPADLFLEVRGDSLPRLAEHALFALYDHMVDLEQVSLREERVVEVEAPTWAESLRRLLSDALSLFYAEHFLTAGARVRAEEAGATKRISASLWGEEMDRARHAMAAEIKAVTYHRLLVEQTGRESWRAQVLLDV